MNLERRVDEIDRKISSRLDDYEDSNDLDDLDDLEDCDDKIIR